jgi:hypothetical protein
MKMNEEINISPKEAESFRKAFEVLSKKEREIEEKEKGAEEDLIKEGFPLEGGTAYPPEDFPRKSPVRNRTKKKVLEALREAGYNFEPSPEDPKGEFIWVEPSTGIEICFNWAPLFKPRSESDFEDYGWGRIFINAFDRSQEVGTSQARLEAGRIARIVKKVPGIEGKHFVGVVVCEGL